LQRHEARYGVVTVVTALNVDDFPYSVHRLPFWT